MILQHFLQVVDPQVQALLSTLEITFIPWICVTPFLFILKIVTGTVNTFPARIMRILVGFSIGTLLGESLLHILPHALLHAGGDHDDHHGHHHGHGHSHESSSNYTMWCIIAGIVIFYAVERVIDIFHSLSESHENEHHYVSEPTTAQPITASSSSSTTTSSSTSLSPSTTTSLTSEPTTPSSGDIAAAFLSIAHDVLHNVTDGMSLALAFQIKQPLLQHNHHHHEEEMSSHFHEMISSASPPLAQSLSSSFGNHLYLAIILHELGHTVSDVCVLMRGGYTLTQACMTQLLTSCGAILGCILGNSIAQFVPAALLETLPLLFCGGFLYVSLGLLRTLHKATEHDHDHHGHSHHHHHHNHHNHSLQSNQAELHQEVSHESSHNTDTTFKRGPHQKTSHHVDKPDNKQVQNPPSQKKNHTTSNTLSKMGIELVQLVIDCSCVLTGAGLMQFISYLE